MTGKTAEGKTFLCSTEQQRKALDRRFKGIVWEGESAGVEAKDDKPDGAAEEAKDDKAAKGTKRDKPKE